MKVWCSAAFFLVSVKMSTDENFETSCQRRVLILMTDKEKIFLSQYSCFAWELVI